MLSNTDIFYIKGVNEIIMSYKEEIEEVIRIRVARRQNISLINHINRMRNHYNQRNHERLIRRQMGIDF